MKVNEIIEKAGTIPALAFAMDGGLRMPRGLHFNESGEGGQDGGDDGGGQDDGGQPGSDDGDDGGQDEGGKVAKAQFDAVLKELRDERKQRKEFEKNLKEIKANAPSKEELEELREFRVKQQKAEEENKKKAGQYENLLKEKEQKHLNEINNERNKYAELESRYREEKIDGVLARYIPQYTTIPVSDVADLVRKHFTFDDDGNMVIKVNGESPINEKGNEMSPEEFIADFISKRDYLAKAAPKGGSGGIGGKGKGSGKGRIFTEEEIAAMPHDEFKKHEAEIMAQIG